MHRELKEKAIRLRLEEQLGYEAIGKQVPVAKSTLSAWLRNFPLSKERINELKKLGWSKSEAKIEKYRATMREKREREDREEYERYLIYFRKRVPQKVFFTSGLMLYLAEGAKTNNYTISISNTDPRIIKFFIRWLNIVFRVSKDKLRASLHLYENMDIEKEKEFWKNELGFDGHQFYKPYITKNKKASFLYKESFRHGTCSVLFSNTVIKRKIMMAIKAYVDTILNNPI
jgi:transposase-like protein